MKPGESIGLTVACLICLVLIIAAFVGGCAGIKSFQRSQQRADASNKVQITHILIKNAQQQAQIVKANNARVQAEADQRVIAAIGIRNAQDHISKTLTPYYLQWEAIQAQMKLAGSPTHTQIYVPTGAQGVPLVQTAPKP